MSHQWGAPDQWGSAGGDSWGQAPAAEPRRNRGRGPWIAAFAVFAVIVIAGAVAAWAFTGRGKTADAVAETPLTSVREETNTPSEVAETTVVETVVAEPELGQCDPSAVTGQPAERLINDYCDGQWFLIATKNSSFVDLFYWTGSEWSVYAPDGESPISGYPCFDKATLQREQAPAGLISAVESRKKFCSDSATAPTSSASASGPAANNGGDWLAYPSCDGRYVVIVDSVIVYPGQDPQPPVNKSVEAHPGAMAVYPGQCASLRASYDGAAVYPVYKDFGSDLASACAAEARGEGFARKLQQVADYSSPC